MSTLVVPLKPIKQKTLPSKNDIKWCVVTFNSKGVPSLSKQIPSKEQINNAYEQVRLRFSQRNSDF